MRSDTHLASIGPGEMLTSLSDRVSEPEPVDEDAGMVGLPLRSTSATVSRTAIFHEDNPFRRVAGEQQHRWRNHRNHSVVFRRYHHVACRRASKFGVSKALLMATPAFLIHTEIWLFASHKTAGVGVVMADAVAPTLAVAILVTLPTTPSVCISNGNFTRSR
ncbi:hypothetical protein [Mycobacterium paraffinicum]|uniref:hypothetical protein n=1 Tax=Mycobacterium paraffinicum TaxID=53378 RepID=UPI0021F28EDD|nr:hypothetical protein [Mycobacterium paraffinicum]